MPIYWWVAVAGLWTYFRWTAANVDARGLSASISSRTITFGNVLRASFVVAPGIALERGYDINANLPLASVALSVLISPLQLPSREPEPDDLQKSAWLFAAKWLFSELERWAKTLLLGAAIWGAQKIVVGLWSPSWNEIEWMRAN